MPLTSRTQYPTPDMWNTFGHSYLQFTGGAVDQTGRFDALFRATLDVEYTNWRNRAVSGAQLVIQGRKLGGFGRIFQENGKNTTRGAPYVGDGGALLMAYGINDLGNSGPGAGFTSLNTTFGHVLRSAISLWRAARVFDNTDATVTYGAGFTSGAGTNDWSFGSSTHNATALTSATFTITLPADYDGSPISICLDGNSTNGGTVTWSGTAGVTGTTSTSGVVAAGLFTHSKMVKRITTLTSANAGQTIIGTVTALDAGGSVSFDCWWIEAKAAPPIIVCNVARLVTAGYALYASWTGTEAAKDQNVVDLNAVIAGIVAEFDSMVQLADIDSAMNKTTAYFWDGLHPNEWGAARCADACMVALRRMTPTTDLGTAANFNVPSPRQGSIVRPRIGGSYYTAEYRANGTDYTPVAGDVWAIPFAISQGRERYIRLCMRLAAGGTVAGTVRWGIYDDVGWTGAPQCLVQEPTSAAALSLGTVTGQVQSPSSGTGSINLTLDPGLYWLCLKVITAGTGQTYETLAGPMSLFMPNLTSAGARLTPAGWKLTGQGSTALADVFPAGAALSDNAPLIGLQLF
ncbi:MAG: hypothetical protein JWO11_3887 [Nocardioides sp.]|nr:hypothetical protein [Nocardioides sp.]